MSTELKSLKSQQLELHTEKQRLLEEISTLQKLRNEDKMELTDLRRKQRQVNCLQKILICPIENYLCVQQDSNYEHLVLDANTLSMRLYSIASLVVC